MKKWKKNKAPVFDGVERAAQQPAPSAVPTVAPGCPTAQQCGSIVLPNYSAYRVVGNGMPMGLPKYTAVDEYGRLYCPIMNYGPLPVSGPVPVATPSSIVQTTPIVTPMVQRPYQEDQSVYYDDYEGR
ncbi:MAG TPA: hypothetical protein IAB14_03850 [Candidatus Stercoripulliclostridium merdipullorum]|uniref:Uncharacterized protein n=1 Tax=Candidatus Stercoripulliclostridium merdipullorum TaxID=2840952 RepID=A0A9D1SX26_9FIRM|nr:hypothetical protein [Candidatus Stercoripulliclostridium merdipullorum]